MRCAHVLNVNITSYSCLRRALAKRKGGLLKMDTEVDSDSDVEKLIHLLSEGLAEYKSYANSHGLKFELRNFNFRPCSGQEVDRRRCR